MQHAEEGRMAGPGDLLAASGQGSKTTPDSYGMPQPSFLPETDATLDGSFNPLHKVQSN